MKLDLSIGNWKINAQNALEFTAVGANGTGLWVSSVVYPIAECSNTVLTLIIGYDINTQKNVTATYYYR